MISEKDLHLFQDRHIGISKSDENKILKELNYESLEDLITNTIPDDILMKTKLNLDEGKSEFEALNELKEIMGKNLLKRSLIGQGYYDTITPSVILRNVFENPAWYTQYTPYQAEIAQGRLEALFNYQTIIADLTGLPIANASLLDEATAAAEAMTMSAEINKRKFSRRFLVADNCHKQTIELVKTKASVLNIEVVVQSPEEFDLSDKPFGLLLQYPDTRGNVDFYEELISRAKKDKIIVTVATDLMALTKLKTPADIGADVAVGNTQRFGVPMGFGGPHAAFFATKDEYKRKIPGRIVGASKDVAGKTAYRLALQTREQHIRRDKATSNICTSQVLLAIMASMYGVYHGPKGLKVIANRIHSLACLFSEALSDAGYDILNKKFFDTISVKTDKADSIRSDALKKGFNLGGDSSVLTIAFDEKSNVEELKVLATAFGASEVKESFNSCLEVSDLRTSAYMRHPVFNSYHTETEMMRYLRKLELRDLSLAQSMISLGSCTMKLNAASELMPVSWAETNSLHPFIPENQAKGYMQLFDDLEKWLCEITGFDAVSLQPNSGAQGEYAGLLAIVGYHKANGDDHRNICIIPSSAHGTNPASAVLAGMKVVVTKCTENGDIDLEDLREKAEKHKDNLSALMITYPSTHGVFETKIREICQVIHDFGGQVYMDGANLNAQIGLAQPGKYGADVMHMNLHKTFAIPHGGGGPGMGPIAVSKHLADFLPSHPISSVGGSKSIGPVSAAGWGSASILLISWMYIRMMGGNGLTRASEIAILSANYMAKRLDPHFPVVFKGMNATVAHECIINLNEVKKTADVSVDDIAKRLIDYGFHAPTVSWPVPNTMMIEPTESESLKELDMFCDAMASIRDEIREIENGTAAKGNNVLSHAPHTASIICGDIWDRPYSRNKAAFPAEYVRENKFWPYVSRVDNVGGDRNLICTCPNISEYE